MAEEDAVAQRAEHRWRALVQHSTELIAVVGADGSVEYATPAVRRLLGWPAGDPAPRALDFVHPDDLARVEADLVELLEGNGGDDPTAARVLAADGTYHDLEILGTNLLHDELVRGVVLNARDVTERRRAESELRLRARQQQVVAVLGHRALMGIDVGVLMSDAAALVADTLDVHLCSVFELDPAEEELCLRAGVGWEDGAVGRFRMQVSADSPSGFAVLSGEAVLLEDLPRDLRFAGSTLLLEHGVRSGVTVSLQGVHRPFGVIGVYSREERQFGPDDVHFLQAVANVLATAIERRQAEEDIRLQSLHDALTKLPNRTLFLDRLEQALARVERSPHGRVVAVLFLDLDRFKVVNDGLGHVAGDELLMEVAARLRSILRPTDTVARFGGDEFVLLLDDIESDDHAVDVAARIGEVFTVPFELSGREVKVTASIGIALTTGRPGERAETLVRDADAAMYRAKEKGKARFEIFDDAIRMRAVRRLETEQALRRAVERGELELLYQPGVWLDSGRVAAVEALARWCHPERGPVPPAEFIPIAEETGLILPLGDWVLEQAAVLAARLQWVSEPGWVMTVAVNLSARQLGDPKLVDRVGSLLAAHGLPPRALSLEITESVLMDDAESARRTLGELKSLGVYLAVDDFGTGYSSLAYLKRFPVDALKVDKSFVDGLGREGEDGAIVRAIVTLAQTLGLDTVAEGVETAEQVERLVELGCVFAQGYHFARPMPAEQLDRWLAGAVSPRPARQARASAGDG
ncbi:MAG TPA: EAL domain-containing protein [Acidimicrobiales bacterium]|nr:EAL domain-containing protein [Acidimicrobiales bacterium]